MIPPSRCLLPVLLLFSSLHYPSLALTTPFRRGLIDTPLGLVHYTIIGDIATAASSRLLPMVAFHMSPRSVDEYKEIMEECHSMYGKARVFVALDEFGHGQSDNPNENCNLDDMADCFLQVMTELKIQKCIAVGSLMGCYFALSLASRHPERIAGVVCSNLYYFPPNFSDTALAMTTAAGSRRNGNNSWKLQQDGSHIGEIWEKRASWLSPELNTRATLDNLLYLVKRRERDAQGIYVQEGASFPLPMTCWQATCPVLCINGVQAVLFMDRVGMDMTGQFQQAMTFFVNPPQKVLMTGSVNMLNENPKEWLSHVDAFARRIE
jgi:pimeloyl-ACP methyl ester carboxylesterase